MMEFSALRQEVLEANQRLVSFGLVTLTWGNVSGIDRKSGVVAIKPSGVEYEQLTAADIVLLDLRGQMLEKGLNPSSDTETHLELYNSFPDIGGITHCHSTYATIFAQAQRDIPVLGTTHADHFCDDIPVTRNPIEQEVTDNYEKNIGRLIVETLGETPPLDLPGVLVSDHGPFTWGSTASAAVQHAKILELVAHMAWGSYQVEPRAVPIPEYLRKKHFTRKHGPEATYGQDRDQDKMKDGDP